MDNTEDRESILSSSYIEEYESIFFQFIKKKRAELWPLARQKGITAFRLFDRDIPEVPFIVDEYDKYLHISQILRPRSNDEVLQDAWVESIASAASRAIGIPRERVFMKARKAQKGHSQYEKVDQKSFTLEVQEYGLRFEVNLSDYLDTGLFLDHRDTREMVRSISNGARVLNLFSYTGSFSVYAAAGGAENTTSVDLSNTYTAWAQRNLALNGFRGKTHLCVSADAFTYLSESIQQRRFFDLIILDPPTFSNSKKMTQTLDVQRDHPQLINQCLRLLSKDGILVFSNNLRGFKLNEHGLNSNEIEDITFATTPFDFKKRKPHHCYIIKKGL